MASPRIFGVVAWKRDCDEWNQASLRPAQRLVERRRVDEVDAVGAHGGDGSERERARRLHRRRDVARKKAASRSGDRRGNGWPFGRDDGQGLRCWNHKWRQSLAGGF